MLGRAMLGITVLATFSVARAELPPVPVPSENPISDEKRVLGKILYWDEQLSSDDSISCGSCHLPGMGGADERVGVNPGPDAVPDTPDDVLGSPGVVLMDSNGQPVADAVFGLGVQVTGRASMSVIGAAYVRDAFWDGRAGSTFIDPETDTISIAAGGALENQALGPILSEVEMANAGRTWKEVTSKLASSIPLARSSNLPPDTRAAIDADPSYPELFESAFGDPAITAERIAYAIATYERTLVADETPWDLFTEGDPTAMTPQQVQGWNFFRNSPCSRCHAGPTFTDQTFRNIGIRPVAEDPGRQAVTGILADRGRFKVPTLRNTGLKTNHMHNGRLMTIRESVLWYRPGNPDRSNDNLDGILPVAVPPNALNSLVEFITVGLTDPRVAAEEFPFDRPTLHAGDLQRLSFADDGVTLEWPLLEGVVSYNVYRGYLSDLADGDGDGSPDGGYGECVSHLDADTTDGMFLDFEVPTTPGDGFFYVKTAVGLDGYETSLGLSNSGQARWKVGICP